MIATVTSLPAAVLYLLLLFAELGGGGDLSVDYLQDGSPLFTICVTRPAADSDEVLRIVAESDGEEPAVYTVEASDFAGHNYLVYSADGSIPFLLNLAPALEQATLARLPADWTLELPGDAELGSAGVDVELGATAHFLRRGTTTVVSAPASGIVLVVVEE